MHTTSNLCGTLPFSYWWYMKKVKCCFTYIHIWSSISATFVEVSKALWHIAHLVFFPLYLYTGQSVSTNLFFQFSFSSRGSLLLVLLFCRIYKKDSWFQYYLSCVRRFHFCIKKSSYIVLETYLFLILSKCFLFNLKIL